MSEITPKQDDSVREDSEISAMQAWLALPTNQRDEFVATGVPVGDPSSQPKLTK